MSIAITTVLPVPVAIFRATRGRPVVVRRVLGLEPARASRASPCRPGDLGEEDRRLGRLALAEQDAVPRARRLAAQCCEQLAGDRRDAAVVAGAPPLDLAADVVDQRVLLAPLAGDVEVDRLLDRRGPSCSPAPPHERLTRPAPGRAAGRSAPSGPISKCGDFRRIIRRADNGVAQVCRQTAAGRAHLVTHFTRRSYHLMRRIGCRCGVLPKNRAGRKQRASNMCARPLWMRTARRSQVMCLFRQPGVILRCAAVIRSSQSGMISSTGVPSLRPARTASCMACSLAA